MKRMLLIALLSCIVFLFTSCGISQEEYDSLKNENDTLKEENESLSEQVKSLSDYKANHVLELMDESYGKAWATVAFGDDSVCFSDADNRYFQCISDKTYPMTDEGISLLWSDLLESASTLGQMKATYPDKMNYEAISIRFYDPSGTHILDVTLKQADGSYELDSITCNILHADTIASAIMSARNN